MTAPIVTEADRKTTYDPDVIEEHAHYLRRLRELNPDNGLGRGTLWQRLGSEHGPVLPAWQAATGRRQFGNLSKKICYVMWKAEPGTQVEGRDKSTHRY